MKRNFECIRAIWNFAARENGVSDPNPFANMNYGNGAAAVKRMPIAIDDIRKVQQLCYQKDDDIRWLVALLSDTGMRLAEAAGLAKEDVFLDTEIPYVRLCERRWRPLKTRSSERDVPLVGAAYGLHRERMKAAGPSTFSLAIVLIMDARRTMLATRSTSGSEGMCQADAWFIRSGIRCGIGSERWSVRLK